MAESSRTLESPSTSGFYKKSGTSSVLLTTTRRPKVNGNSCYALFVATSFRTSLTQHYTGVTPCDTSVPWSCPAIMIASVISAGKTWVLTWWKRFGRQKWKWTRLQRRLRTTTRLEDNLVRQICSAARRRARPRWSVTDSDVDFSAHFLSNLEGDV